MKQENSVAKLGIPTVYGEEDVNADTFAAVYGEEDVNIVEAADRI